MVRARHGRSVTKGFDNSARAQRRPRQRHFTTTSSLHNSHTYTSHTMAPKRSNQPGAISQMYTSLASPDNRSVVTAVTFFVVSNRSATSTPSHSKAREKTEMLTCPGRCRFLAQQLERDVASSVSLFRPRFTRRSSFLRHTIKFSAFAPLSGYSQADTVSR
jgi:hypothetical protein